MDSCNSSYTLNALKCDGADSCNSSYTLLHQGLGETRGAAAEWHDSCAKQWMAHAQSKTQLMCKPTHNMRTQRPNWYFWWLVLLDVIGLTNAWCDWNDDLVWLEWRLGMIGMTTPRLHSDVVGSTAAAYVVIYTYIHTYLHTYIHTYMYVCMYVYMRILMLYWICIYS